MSRSFVRPARRSDAGDIAAVSWAAWSQMPWMAVDEHTNLVSLLRDHWENLLDSPAASNDARSVHSEDTAETGNPAVTTLQDIAFVATLNDVVVGWLLLTSVEGTPPNVTCEVLDLVIAPTHQNQGHGSRLMHAAADAARQQHAQWLSMWCPLPDEPRRAFLVSHGFAPDGAIRDLQSDDEKATLREVRLRAGLLDNDSAS